MHPSCGSQTRLRRGKERRAFRIIGAIAFATACLLNSGHGRAGDSFDRTHAEFQKVLEDAATQDGVDYGQLKRTPNLLDAYLTRIASLEPGEFASWDRHDRLALLINLYNATTLRVIRDHYPIASIREIGFLPGAAWREPTVRWCGKTNSLDHLEHKVLRQEYREPRIHFALVCAAQGCPPLRLEPYQGKVLEQQLNEQARTFLAQSEKNRFEPLTDTLWLSPIFKWYLQDFAETEDALSAYVRPFLSAPTRTRLDTSPKVRIRFTEYNWNLNDAPRPKR